MTGFMIRIQRDGHWQTIDVDCLTDAELEGWAETGRENNPLSGWIWAKELARWIRENVREPAPTPNEARVDRGESLLPGPGRDGH
jgi:hypothetical protein